jgi:hypothetical protein
MGNDDKALGANEVEARLSELLSEMSEADKRDFLEKLEEWQTCKQKEKRKYPRKRISIYAVCSGADSYFRDYIQNIGAGGIFIQTQSPLFINQELTTTFFLPASKAPIKAKGKVVRTDSNGIAIEFDEAIPDI